MIYHLLKNLFVNPFVIDTEKESIANTINIEVKSIQFHVFGM